MSSLPGKSLQHLPSKIKASVAQRQSNQPSAAPAPYRPSVQIPVGPPVFRPAPAVVNAKLQSGSKSQMPGLPVFKAASVPALHRRAGGPGVPVQAHAAWRSQTIQRYCRNPNCTDPACDDERNHGHDRVYALRDRTLFFNELGGDGGGVVRGTGTTSTTRESVNTRPVPTGYSLTYSGVGGSGHTELDNPPSLSGRYDAGHIVGAQHGGLGHDPASVFPQNAQYNRGNSHQGESTFDFWRRHENNINQQARGGGVRQTVTVSDAPRVTYYNCLACGRLRGSAVACSCGAP